MLFGGRENGHSCTAVFRKKICVLQVHRIGVCGYGWMRNFISTASLSIASRDSLPSSAFAEVLGVVKFPVHCVAVICQLIRKPSTQPRCLVGRRSIVSYSYQFLRCVVGRLSVVCRFRAFCLNCSINLLFIWHVGSNKTLC